MSECKHGYTSVFGSHALICPYCELGQLKEDCANLRADRDRLHKLCTERGIELTNLEQDRQEMLADIKLHLTYHEHGCAYLGKYVDYEEVYK